MYGSILRLVTGRSIVSESCLQEWKGLPLGYGFSVNIVLASGCWAWKCSELPCLKYPILKRQNIMGLCVSSPYKPVCMGKLYLLVITQDGSSKLLRQVLNGVRIYFDLDYLELRKDPKLRDTVCALILTIQVIHNQQSPKRMLFQGLICFHIVFVICMTLALQGFVDKPLFFFLTCVVGEICQDVGGYVLGSLS